MDSTRVKAEPEPAPRGVVLRHGHHHQYPGPDLGLHTAYLTRPAAAGPLPSDEPPACSRSRTLAFMKEKRESIV